MLLVLVILTLLATTTALAVAGSHDKKPGRSFVVSIGTAAVYPPRPDRPCPGSRRAIRFYRAAYTAHRRTMGEPGAPALVHGGCKTARTMAVKWRGLARQARVALARWHAYHYDWPSWLPDGWAAIARCETGMRWDWNSGAYQGSFGFAVSSWDAFVGAADPKAGPYPSEAYEATPRQQYEVALAIWRRYGLSGWGCRGAYYR